MPTVDYIDDSIITDPKPKELLRTLQLLDTRWARIVLQCLDLGDDLALGRFRKGSQFLFGRLEELDCVGHFG